LTAARLLRTLALGLVLVVIADAAGTADEEFHVLRVSGALVYLDAGTRHGVKEGDTFVVLVPQGAVPGVVAEVRAVRVLPAYAIAEVVFTESGRQIEPLQQAIPRAVWDLLPHPELPATPSPAVLVPPPDPSRRSRFVQLLAGGDWGRRAGLEWDPRGRLKAARRGVAASAALRLGAGLTPRWRAALTYRLAAGGEVTQLGVEADLQLLLRTSGRVRPYVAAGTGLHHLSRTVPGQQDDSAIRAGGNLLLGLELAGPWRLSVEGGYQRVGRWEDLIDLSHLRTWAGLGRRF
jgi:hypothetical protein